MLGKSLTLKLVGILSVGVAVCTPAWAGERTREEVTLKTQPQFEMRDGKMFKRTLRSVRKNVEVDIEVPVARTRQDPITRYVPNASPLTYPGVPGAGTRTVGNTRTEVSLATNRDEALHATLVTVQTRTFMQILEKVFVFSSAWWQSAFNIAAFKGTFLDNNWPGGMGTYNSNIRPQLAAMFSRMSSADYARVVQPNTYMVFTENAQYVAHLPGSYFGNLETHYGEGGSLNIGSEQYSVIASFLFSPLALDLNHDGKINVTGKATGVARYDRSAGFTSEDSVQFDLRGLGKAGRYEWLQGSGDGFLVDDRKGRVSTIAKGNGKISGLDLFGGHFDGNGFLKAARLFGSRPMLASLAAPSSLPRPGHVLEGNALRDIKVWIDADHDARVTPAELKTCQELGITTIDLGYQLVGDAAETRMVSTFTQNGENHLLEDVWFAEGPLP